MNRIEHSLPYSKELDGLRGIAILLVLLFHLWPNIFTFGFAGVDVFFVLSGYLITSIIVTKAEFGTFSFYEFYRNRIRRIFPTLILVLASCSLVGWLFLFPDELKLLGSHIKGSAFFFQNLVLIGEQGYWDTNAKYKPLLHFWSLSVEEQFYLIWPWVILLLTTVKRINLLVVVAALLFFISSGIENEIKAFYHAQSRFWELALGGAIIGIEKNKSLEKFFEHTAVKFVGSFFLQSR